MGLELRRTCGRWLQMLHGSHRWSQLRGVLMADHHFEQVKTWIVGEGRQDSDARTAAFFLSRA